MARPLQKDARIDLRLSKEDKEQIQKLALQAGMTLTDYLIYSAKNFNYKK